MSDRKTHIVRGKTEMHVFNGDSEIVYGFPAQGPNTYREVGASILKNGMKVPTGDLIAPLVHAAYCSEVKNEPEFADVRERMIKNWLCVFNQDLWTPQGLYVVQDEKAEGLSKKLDVKDLESRLKNGKEVNGVRFSEDGKTRFAPKGSYKLEWHTPESFAKDGFVIANYGVKGASLLSEVSQAISEKPFIYGLNIADGQENIQRVSTLYVGSGRLLVLGNSRYDFSGGCGFGVYAP